jgi:hypothetical protein
MESVMALTPKQKDDLLKEVRERMKWCIDDEFENRKMAMDDLEFIALDGAQWPEAIRQERESDGRPCITVNKMPTFIDQVVGDQRQNRPSIKVFPVDNKGDKRTAKILDGWIKNVFHTSVADPIIDHAFEHAVACGYGAWRVVTEYNSDDSFEQDAKLKKIDNALAVYWGPHSNYDCSDADYCFIVSDIPRSEYEDKYKETGMPFAQADSRYIEGWCTDKTIRVAEYYVKKPVKKTIYQLTDGRTVDTLEEGDESAKQRSVDGYKVMWYLVTGDDVKDEKEWAGKKYIPVIPVWGKELNVGGKRIIRGLVRNAKDPARMYNYWASCDTELVALAPKVPFLVTPKQVQGHEQQWKNSSRKNYPYLLVNSDPKAPGWPQRQAPPQASTAMSEKIAMSDQEIRDTMGLQKASLGMQSNERSGKAIMERQKAGDTGTFAFADNLVRSLEHTGRVLVDVSSTILDTERIIRLGTDSGKFKPEAINVPDGDKVLNDLTVGKYDVVCKVGPSFATQRSEARQSMSEFIQYFPPAAPLIGDIFADMMDWPRAEEVAERLGTVLPPEIRALKAKREAEESGEPDLPPSDSPEMQPPPPDPVQEMKIAEMQGQLKIIQIKIQQEEAKLGGLILENKIKAGQADADMIDRERERSAEKEKPDASEK